MSLISINNLTFAYDGSYDNIFENVSFQIDTDWKLGFVGRNGRGKTTFLNLLLGKHEYTGSISASVRFDYFPFHVSDKSLDTLQIAEQICPLYQLWELERELSILDIDSNVLYRSFSTLSGGEQSKVLLAALFLKENSFLLIDEPTNHLDREARSIVSDYLNSKKGYILVSHDRAFLDKCTDHILSINKTNITLQRGNFSSWWHNKELEDNFELAENQRIQKDIKRLSDAAKRTSGWSDQLEATKLGTKNSGLRPDRGFIGHKSAKMMKRSKSIEERRDRELSEKEKLLKNIEENESLSINPMEYHSKRLLELVNLSGYYGDRVACENINFSLNTGDRLALVGKNGSGKSTILKLILGENISHTGTLNVGSQLVTSYVPQDTSFLRGSLSEFARENSIDESLFKAILRKLDFSRIQFEKNMADFSGGQKKKVLIAKSLCERAHLYIWDEPLNFIDVLSRIQIEELIQKYKPTMLFVEHDSIFCENIATGTVN